MTGRERFEAGDGLRGLAALAIVVWHALAFTLLFEPGVPTRPRLGDDGLPLLQTLPAVLADGLPQLRDAVWVFFTLSGYLLARPFVHAWRGTRDRPSLRRYARHRVLRIVPAFWAVVALTVLVRGPGGDGPRELVALLGFSQLWIDGATAGELSHLWSLSVEAGFYLALPFAALALLALPRSIGVGPVAGLLLALAGLSLLAQTHVAGTGNLLGVPAGIPLVLLVTLGAAFVPGLLLALAEPRARRVLAGRRTGIAASALVAVAALAALIDSGVPQSRPATHQLLLTIVGGALVTAALVREWSGAPPWRPLVAPATRWLGERSYSLFLVHLLVLTVLIEALGDLGPWPSAAVALGAGVPLSLLAAWGLHAAVEAPFLRLRERPAARSARTIAATAPPASPHAVTPAGAPAPPAASSSASRR